MVDSHSEEEEKKKSSGFSAPFARSLGADTAREAFSSPIILLAPAKGATKLQQEFAVTHSATTREP